MAVRRRIAPIRWLRGHTVVADALLGCGLALLMLGAGFAADVRAEGFKEPSWVWVLLTLVETLPLALRRRHSVAVFWVVGGVTILNSALDYATPGFGPLVATYTVAAGAGRRTSLSLLGIALVGAATSEYLGPGPHRIGGAIGTTIMFLTAWALGDNLQSRRSYVAGLEERAERLERDREDSARRAVADERTRIARELHDVVAHHVSVMVVQAGGARRVLAKHPDQAGDAIATVEATGRQARSERRAMLAALRDDGQDGAGRAPQPGAATVPVLVDQVRAAGLPIAFEVRGEQVALTPGVDAALYRIVQEALTNVLKHGGPVVRAEVAITYEPDAVRIAVVDDGRGAAAPQSEAGGHGLIGMRERVAFLGGTFRAGPRSGPGWTVAVSIPFEREKQ